LTARVALLDLLDRRLASAKTSLCKQPGQEAVGKPQIWTLGIGICKRGVEVWLCGVYSKGFQDVLTAVAA